LRFIYEIEELDNLYVVDTSFRGTGAVSSAVTGVANTLRLGDHVLERLRARLAIVPASVVAS
jgi:hypothetical protein